MTPHKQWRRSKQKGLLEREEIYFFESCLLELFQQCRSCGQEVELNTPFRGTLLVVQCTCCQVITSWQPTATNQLGKDNYRYIQRGLESSLQGDDYRRSLVTDSGLVPHKLLGDASSLPSSSMLYKGCPSPLHNLSLHGQHYNNLIPKPQRRDNFPLPLAARQMNLAVVHVPEHFSSCRSPTYLDISIQWQTESPGYYCTDGTGNSTQNLSKSQPNMGATDHFHPD